MRQILRAIRTYYLFAIALAASAVALPLNLAGFSAAAHWILIATSIFELMPLVWGMLQDLRRGKYGVDILAATAITTSLLLGEYWAGMVIVLMLTGGQALEDYAGHRAEHELDALLTRAPQKARILRGGKEVEVKVSEVRTGDMLIIRPGELVPVDAVITEGSANFDESSLTGESLPQSKEKGEELLSGSINIDGSIKAKALRSAEDSQYQQIIKLVKAARGSQAPFVRLADRYAVPFTAVSFAVAITAWALSGEPIRFLEVIVVATPCPLILAAPIAIVSGMSRSAKHGIIIKTGGALERLAGVHTVAFDKTGTLTKGQLRIEHIKAFHGFSQDKVLAIAAGLEQHSNHAQAAAIVAGAKEKRVELPPTSRIREVAGKGITGTVAGKPAVVGKLALLEEHGVAMPKAFDAASYNQTAAFVAAGGELAGVITFADTVREESKSTIAALRKLDITNFMMVTGDNEHTAKKIAKPLGITEVVANALPGDKIQAVKAAAHKPVAFVGDGINDAPVLAASDVGIALGARGSAAASESADVVIVLDDLTRVARGIEIAKRTFTIAKQSVWIGIALSVALMLIFSTGRFLPIHGAIIQEVVDVIVIFNALRAHSDKRTAKQED